MMIKKIWLSLLLFLWATATTVSAAKLEISPPETFESEESISPNMTMLENIRYSYGSGTVRIVLDLTGAADFVESTAENPSRSIIDLKNVAVEKVLHNYNQELNSTAAKRVRVAQFNATTARIVIETMAAVKVFKLNGGPAGYRIVVDIGNAAFKENPELNKPVNTDDKKKSDDKKVTDDKKKSDDKKVTDDKKKSDDEKSKDKDKDKKVNDKNKKSGEKDPDKKLDEDLKSMMTLQDKIIVIDAGHGGNDAGAIGPTGVTEKSVTLRVSLEIEKLLKAEGATVIMTRKTDKVVSEKGTKASDIEELQARCDVANSVKADIFISIHCDSFTNPNAKGTTGYYYSKSDTDAGRRLADAIRRGICEQIKTPSRGTKPCNFYVVRHTDMPATLIELAFISNLEEEKILDSEEGIKKTAQGILDGIEDYFG